MTAIQIKTKKAVDYTINEKCNVVEFTIDGVKQIWLGISDFFIHFKQIN